MQKPHTNEPKLPTLEQLEEAIREFGRIDWQNIDNLNQVNQVIPWPIKAMSLWSFEKDNCDSYFYRARPYHGIASKFKKGDNIYKIQSFSYAPKGSFSRAGTAGVPIFYASSNFECALMESKTSDALNYVACWKIKKTTKIKLYPFTSNLPEHIKTSDDYFIKGWMKVKDDFVRMRWGEEGVNIFKKLDEFHDKQFTKNLSWDKSQNKQFTEKIYKYSSWLANNVINNTFDDDGKRFIDGIAYQSIIDPRLGTNFAIDPNFVDSHMELENVYLMTHQYKHEKNKFDRLLLSIGTPKNGILEWKIPDKASLYDFKKKHDVPLHAAKISGY